MTIAVKKSGSWTAGQGMKMTGTGVGMKVMNTGPVLGSATNPYVLSLSATPFTFNIDSSVSSEVQPGQYAKIFKITVPAGQIVTIDTAGSATGYTLIRAWLGVSTYANRNSGTAYMASFNPPEAGYESRVTLNNTLSATPVDCVFEVAAHVAGDPTVPSAQVRVQQLPSLGATRFSQIVGRFYSGGAVSSMSDLDGQIMSISSGTDNMQINTAGSEWASPVDPKDYFIYQRVPGGSDSSKYFRISVDGGTTWTDQGASQTLTPDYLTGVTGWAIDLRAVVGSVSSGDTVNIQFQVSVDGSTWADLLDGSSNPLSISVDVI